jgi:hypothetical protein
MAPSRFRRSVWLEPPRIKSAELVAPHGSAMMSALASWSTGGQLLNFAAAAGPERLARCYD